MKGNQTRSFEDRIQQSAEIAVTGKNFRVFFDELKVQVGKELHGAVSTALSKDDPNLRIQKSCMNFFDLCGIRGHPGRDRPISDTEAKLFEIFNALDKIPSFSNQPAGGNRANDSQEYSPLFIFGPLPQKSHRTWSMGHSLTAEKNPFTRRGCHPGHEDP
jgi:hypothetical protein